MGELSFLSQAALFADRQYEQSCSSSLAVLFHEGPGPPQAPLRSIRGWAGVVAFRAATFPGRLFGRAEASVTTEKRFLKEPHEAL